MDVFHTGRLNYNVICLNSVHHNFGGTQQSPFKLVAALQDPSDCVRFEIGSAVETDSLMSRGIKGFTFLAHRKQAMTPKRIDKKLVGHGDALEHILTSLVFRTVRNGQFEVVEGGDEILKNFFRSVLEMILMFALQSLLEILRLGLSSHAHIKHFGLGSFQSCFQLSYLFFG